MYAIFSAENATPYMFKCSCTLKTGMIYDNFMSVIEFLSIVPIHDNRDLKKKSSTRYVQTLFKTNLLKSVDVVQYMRPTHPYP